MTDKEVIIDDVNVAGCEAYFHDTWHNMSHCLDRYSEIKCECEDYPNCYYKQLQRKEQECEKLKVKLMQKDEVNMFFNTPVDGWNDDPCKICPYKQDFQRLQAENEELKKFKNRLLKPIILPLHNEPEIINKSDRYKQALEEIKALINHCDNQDICTFCEYDKKCRDEYDYTLYSNHKPILTIINEVLKDE